MRCPKDGSEMRAVRAVDGNPMTGEAPGAKGGILLDPCDECGGTWYDSAELNRLVGTRLDGLSFEDGAEWRLRACRGCGAAAPETGDACPSCGVSLVVSCPRCDGPLRRIRLGGFSLEACPTCGGLFLDAGEATAIAGALGVTGPGPGGNSGATCTRCGRTGLAARDTMFTEDGLVCDRCGHEEAQDDSRRWQEINEPNQAHYVHGSTLESLLIARLLSGRRR